MHEKTSVRDKISSLRVSNTVKSGLLPVARFSLSNNELSAFPAFLAVRFSIPVGAQGPTPALPGPKDRGGAVSHDLRLEPNLDRVKASANALPSHRLARKVSKVAGST